MGEKSDFINECRDLTAGEHFSDLLEWLNARHLPTPAVPLLQLASEAFGIAHCEHATAAERMLGAIAYAALLHVAFATIQHPIPTTQFASRQDIFEILDPILSLRSATGDDDKGDAHGQAT